MSDTYPQPEVSDPTKIEITALKAPQDTKAFPKTEKPKLDNRHLFRQLVVQRLYNWDYSDRNQLDRQVRELEPATDLEFDKLSNKINKRLLKSEVKIEETATEVWNKKADLDKIIAEFATAWPIEQINLVDLQILRLALYEGFVASTVPRKVAIDEAIELARDFGGDSNTKFVSGVLGNIYNREGEPENEA